MGIDPVSLLAEAGVWLATSAGATSTAAAIAPLAATGTSAATAASLSAAGFGTAAELTGASTLSTLALGSAGLSAVGGVVGAMGAKQTADAQAKAAQYQAQVDAQNAKQAEANAAIAGQVGEAQAGLQSMKGKANVGAILAQQGASGIDPYTGSARDVRQSAADISQLNALTVRSEAIKQAYGHQVEAKSFESQATLGNYESSAFKKSGSINEASTLLGGITSAADKFSNWQLTSGSSL